MRLALLEPDIPQNTAALLRLGACLGVPIDLIEPFGFVFDDRRLRRVGMDYVARAAMTRHRSWSDFEAERVRTDRRLILLTTKSPQPYHSFEFRNDDTLLLGRESAGAPEAVHAAADARLCIPMAPGLRSLNIALAAAMVLGEALRQTAGFPRMS